ncbi:MAG: hypothetical protein JST22_15200 [Bacteroidetes bacterium]|nr:hypothetical protein [Bacteroidota bacterium]
MSEVEQATYVFLDPDGTSAGQSWPQLLVLRATGIVYGSQVAGYANEERRAEGYLVPLGQKDAEKELARFFWEEFHGHSYPASATWTEDRLRRLEELVGGIRVMRVWMDDSVTTDSLRLDHARIDELTEAWVPVHSPYGLAILLFRNCD